jgi:hypothetical protein
MSKGLDFCLCVNIELEVLLLPNSGFSHERHSFFLRRIIGNVKNNVKVRTSINVVISWGHRF